MKTSKKIISMILCLVMLCSIMSIAAFADSDDPEVTVYVTTGMYTIGGYDYTNHTPVRQTLKNLDPEDNPFSYYEVIPVDYWSIESCLEMCHEVYDENYAGDVNVLDAIIFSLMMNGFDCYGGWDNCINRPQNVPGGYVHDVLPNGSGSVTVGSETDSVTGVTYATYLGKGWRVAIKYPGETYFDIEDYDLYATSFDIVDGMEIIFDYSDYLIYDLY